MFQHTTKTGVPFNFHVNAPNDSWYDKPGIYVFCVKNIWGGFGALYVGQAKSFRDRFASHEKWNDAISNGMSHVLGIEIPQQQERDRLEQILIEDLTPPMNTHHMPAPLFAFSASRGW